MTQDMTRDEIEKLRAQYERYEAGKDGMTLSAKTTGDLARIALSLMDKLADAQAAQVLLVEGAAERCEEHARHEVGREAAMLKSHAAYFRTLAPDAGVKALAELRAERDEFKRLALAGNLIALEMRTVESDRDRLASELAEARKREDELWNRIRRLESRDGVILITTKEEHDAARAAKTSDPSDMAGPVWHERFGWDGNKDKEAGK